MKNDWIKPTIKDLREWGCNALADVLAAELEELERVNRAKLVLSAAVVVIAAYLVIVQPAQASFNPFEGLFGKSEEQRKQEIYKVVDNSLSVHIENCEVLSPCPARNLDAVELTNRIYEEEKLEGKEFSEVIINTKVGSEVIDEIWK